MLSIVYCFKSVGRILLLPLLVLTTACGGDASADPTPPTVHYGEDICEFCGMIISEERFAAGYLTETGEEYIFDDIGDMIQAYEQNQQTITTIFVHDHETHTWIRAETAHYVMSSDLPTPMLSGVAAFTTAEEAAGFAAEWQGQTFKFEELVTYYRQNPPAPVFSDLNRSTD